ncbi:tyrosine-type recombinase/integrase [Methylobacterium komagatae]
MSLVFDTGLFRVTIRYVKTLKKGAPFSYYRRIPRELRHHYQGKEYIRESLKTRDPVVAARKANELAKAHDTLWASLRSPEGTALGLTTTQNREAAKVALAEIGLTPGMLAVGAKRSFENDPADVFDAYLERQLGKRYLEVRHGRAVTGNELDEVLTPVHLEMLRLLKGKDTKSEILLSEVLGLYLKDHSRGHVARFSRNATRAIEHIYSVIGDLPLTSYRREHAVKVRDKLLESGMKTATVRRRINDLKAIFNKGKVEAGLGAYQNPFELIAISRENEDSDERPPFTLNELQTIATACRSKDDDIRYIVALLADTGARLAEIVGLRVDDVFLDHETPYILIRPHVRLGRTIKTATSKREVPLVGEALWGAKNALRNACKAANENGWLFPRYASDGSLRATSASAIINIWLRTSLKIDRTAHSFRHSMRDRLRHAGVPKEFQDLIGGWGSRSVGQRYGEGYLLRQLKEQLEKVVVDHE